MPYNTPEARRAYHQKYNAKPENKARARELANRPEARAKKRAYGRAYNASLEGKAKRKEQSSVFWQTIKSDPAKRKNWNEQNRRRNTGCTPEQFLALNYAQGSRCAVCMEPAYGKRMHVDHDHDTGRVRGLLCAFCNTAEGLLRGNALNLHRYLIKGLA